MLGTNDFHALAICEQHTLIGILTSTDLIKYLLAQ
ncbi:hypothetical protein [Flavobacterium sp. 28A]